MAISKARSIDRGAIQALIKSSFEEEALNEFDRLNISYSWEEALYFAFSELIKEKARLELQVQELQARLE